jgi:hypothetical protein
MIHPAIIFPVVMGYFTDLNLILIMNGFMLTREWTINQMNDKKYGLIILMPGLRGVCEGKEMGKKSKYQKNLYTINTKGRIPSGSF